MKLVVAVTGASGAIYARRLLDLLAAMQLRGEAALEEVGLVVSTVGERIWEDEIGAPLAYPFRRWAIDDFSAPFASGSARWDAMVVIPCSAGALGRIAHGVSESLIGRAADVMLKERQRLVLVLRETPLGLIQIDNMATVARAGAVVLPACPSFYGRPATLEAAVDTVVARVLDHVGLPHQLGPRWGEQP